VKMIFKFNNGDQVSVPIADHSSGYWDVVVHLRAIEEKDSPIEIVLDNGETYVSSGKELVSVELKFK
jgi:hypothetical protein